MTMKKWIQVNEIGELYKERVLVHFDVPLLFVCKDNSDNRYLVLCVDEEKGQYLCLKVANTMLLKMLKKEITMADTFKKISDKENFFISYDFLKGKFTGCYISVTDLTPEMLPDEGAYFELKNRKIIEYIEMIEEEEKALAQSEKVITVKLDVLPQGIALYKNLVSYKDSETWQVVMPQRKVNRQIYKNSQIENYQGLLINISQLNKHFKMNMRCTNNNFINLFTDAYNTDTYNTESGGVARCLMS